MSSGGNGSESASGAAAAAAPAPATDSAAVAGCVDGSIPPGPVKFAGGSGLGTAARTEPGEGGNPASAGEMYDTNSGSLPWKKGSPHPHLEESIKQVIAVYFNQVEDYNER